MFAPRLHGPHRLQRLHRLHRLSHLAGPFARFGDDFADRWERRVHRGRRGPSIARLLLAGLAVFAFVKVMSAASRRRSTAERVALGGLILLFGAILMSFRRSAARQGW